MLNENLLKKELEKLNKEFGLTTNEDGTVTYVEHQIGCFTADAPVIQYDETTEKEFVFDEDNIVVDWKNDGDFYTDTKTGIEAQKLYNYINSYINY